MYQHLLKPFLDKLLATLLLVVLLPVMAVIFLFLLVFNNGKVFFIQQRPGLHAAPFKLLKFRTMAELIDEDGELLPDNLRISAFGRFLRNTSLDELPQLINVIKGDMSFVGPRPLLMEYLPLYSATQAKRHNVRPGITGLAQVKGRNLLSWEEKFKYDLVYVQNVCFTLDLKIMALTLVSVIAGRGVDQARGITMEKFKLE